MPLEFQIVQAPMRLGLSEGVEPHQTPFGTLTRAENVCWSKTGLLEHRLGTQALSRAIVGGGSISSAKRLMVRDTELALTDGSSLYSHTADGWVSRGTIPSIGLTWDTSHASMLHARASDSVVVGNTIVEAWVAGAITSAYGDNSVLAGGTLYYQIRNLDTGEFITRPERINWADVKPHIRLVASGTSWFLFYGSLTGDVRCFTYALNDVSIATDGFTTRTALDACLNGSDLLLSYQSAAAGIALVRLSVAASPVVATTAYLAAQTTQSLSIRADSTTLYLAWVTETTTVRCATAHPTTLAAVVAPFNLESAGVTIDRGGITVGIYSPTQAIVSYWYLNQNKEPGVMRVKLVTSAGVATDATAPLYGLQLLSQVFQLAGKWLCFVSNVRAEFGSSQFGVTSDTLLLDVTPNDSSYEPLQVGKSEAYVSANWWVGYLSSASFDGLGSAYVTTPFLSEPFSAQYGAYGVVGARLVRARSESALPTDMWRTVTVDREGVFAAGMLGVYDGVEAIGYGWPYGPLIDRANSSTSATGGLILAGAYLYNVVAERRSSVGILHRSPVGLDYSVTTTGTTSSNTIAVVSPSAGHATRSVGAVVLFRSVINGSIPQRIGFPPTYMSVVDFAVSFPATVLDTKADATIGPGGVSMPLATRPALYTVGGELEDVQPPSALTIAYHQNRIWTVSGDGFTVWISKDRATNPGYAPGFNPALTLLFEKRLTALVSMDEKLVAFAADTLWVVLGQGPAPNGQGGSYEIAPIQTDVGCINPRSIVSTPEGIMFESARGIYMLGRGLDLSWVGRPVKDELGDGQITSAVLVASRNEIRFTVNGYTEASPDTLRCVVLVYNYVERQWTTSTYAPEGVSGALIVDAVMWNGAWTAVTDTGVVFSESADAFLDVPSTGSGVMADAVYETAWINAAGPLSFQSVRNFSLEGVARSAHSLTIEAGFDSDDAYPQSKTFNVTAAGPADYEISIGTRRKCHAIRFRLTVAAPSEGETTGEGLALSMLGIEVGGKRGFAKKPTQKTG